MKQISTNYVLKIVRRGVVKSPSTIFWVGLASCAQLGRKEIFHMFFHECLFFFTLLSFIGCATNVVKNEWQWAQSMNKTYAYEKFLEEYPNSEFAPKARELLSELVWNEIKNHSNKEELKEFLSEFPDSRHRKNAKESLREIEKQEIQKDKWLTAKNRYTVESFDAFISENPDSPYLNEARLYRCCVLFENRDRWEDITEESLSKCEKLILDFSSIYVANNSKIDEVRNSIYRYKQNQGIQDQNSSRHWIIDEYRRNHPHNSDSSLEIVDNQDSNSVPETKTEKSQDVKSRKIKEKVRTIIGRISKTSIVSSIGMFDPSGGLRPTMGQPVFYFWLKGNAAVEYEMTIDNAKSHGLVKIVEVTHGLSRAQSTDCEGWKVEVEYQRMNKINKVVSLKRLDAPWWMR